MNLGAPVIDFWRLGPSSVPDHYDLSIIYFTGCYSNALIDTVTY